jgi:hypothetical protein
MKHFTKRLRMLLIALPLAALLILGCTPTKVQSDSPCYLARAPFCVEVGALLIGVGIAGEGATATVVWNPSSSGYVVRDKDGDVLITGHQGEIVNGQHPRCLRRMQSATDGAVDEWARQSVLGNQRREVLDAKDLGLIVQREIVLRFFGSDGRLSGVAVACTQWGLTQSKLAIATEILGTIDWSPKAAHR